MSDEFNELDNSQLSHPSHPSCPSCGEEISDVHNGGDPAPWWGCKNIPDANFKCKCSCGQVYRVRSEWSPVFSVIPIEHDHEFENDYSSLEEC